MKEGADTMNESINRRTAQQIVEAVKDVCGYDINFIRPDGTIDASTNSERIGTFHKIGRKAAKSGQVLEVEEDDSFTGSRRGINLPFVYRGRTIAVIGISGKPDEVRKYAYLAQRITWLILRERELDRQSRNQQAEIRYVIQALTQGEEISDSYLEDFLAAAKLDGASLYRSVLIRLDSRWNPTNLSMIEQQIVQCFRQTGNSFYTFHYPREYIQILEDLRYPKSEPAFRQLASSCAGLLSVGIGSPESLRAQNRSFQNALLAGKAASARSSFFACYDDLDLELLLAGVPDDVRSSYQKKTVSSLSEKERSVLSAYFAHGCQLKETAEALYIHKNTLQYQLDRIHQITGYNPRKFRDAVVLFTAFQLS